MKHNPHELRRMMRCGYIPPDQHVAGGGWQPKTFDVETCAGYTTALPEAQDVMWSYPHWETGQLAIACDGGQPPRTLMAGCAVLRGAVNDFQNWQMRNPKKDGGV